MLHWLKSLIAKLVREVPLLRFSQATLNESVWAWMYVLLVMK